MKKLKSLLFLLALTGSAIPSVADQSSPQGGSRPPIILTRSNGQGYLKTPKAPDRQVITCSYDGEMLTLNFIYSEGWAALSVIDDCGYDAKYFVDSSDLYIQLYIGPLIGTIYIQLETEADKDYQGVLE